MDLYLSGVLADPEVDVVQELLRLGIGIFLHRKGNCTNQIYVFKNVHESSSNRMATLLPTSAEHSSLTRGLKALHLHGCARISKPTGRQDDATLIRSCG